MRALRMAVVAFLAILLSSPAFATIMTRVENSDELWEKHIIVIATVTDVVDIAANENVKHATRKAVIKISAIVHSMVEFDADESIFYRYTSNSDGLFEELVKDRRYILVLIPFSAIVD